MQIRIDDEYSTLQTALLGPTTIFRLTEPMNSTQRRYFQADPPRKEIIQQEQAAFVQALEANGVGVVWADEVAHAAQQLTPRDIAFAIGDTFFLGRPGLEVRRPELEGLSTVVSEMEGRVVEPPTTGALEGGDVLVDGDTVWIGQGERSDGGGVAHVRAHLADRYDVRPLVLGNEMLHLDVVFTIIAPGLALAYPGGFKGGVVPDELRERYEIIEATAEEQAELGVNVLCIGENRVFSQPRMNRINGLLRDAGMNVIEIEFSETVKDGGAFRCATLPLVRATP